MLANQIITTSQGNTASGYSQPRRLRLQQRRQQQYYNWLRAQQGGFGGFGYGGPGYYGAPFNSPIAPPFPTIPPPGYQSGGPQGGFGGYGGGFGPSPYGPGFPIGRQVMTPDTNTTDGQETLLNNNPGGAPVVTETPVFAPVKSRESVTDKVSIKLLESRKFPLSDHIFFFTSTRLI